ncbi:hypothetical protein OS493_009041 [Desmophyllum pertusum]|uniref:Uncharacterized protein n=1 Tax=Desmophyllum pertusum TaxID=174260 RepID=A0A9W9ZIG4_9CNID|nr:hypothetical protein OS493_009041 [Desmophyllum pertusum]
MAADLFRRNPPTREINHFLRRNMHSYLSNTGNPATMHSISRFYNEVEAAIGVLEGKYLHQSRNSEVQQLVGTQSMVINALKKIHTKVCCRLRPTPNLASPWRGEFTMDIPQEVFNVIAQHIIQRNSYGHQYKETPAVIYIEITDLKKAVFIFDKMNLESNIIPKEELLKKDLSSRNEESQERCEIVVKKTKPMTFKFYKNSKVLSVHFNYGHWNAFGVPQH